MGYLTNLEGVSKKETDCVFLEPRMNVNSVLKQGKAVAGAGTNGAFSVWKDDSGFLRGEFCRHYITIEKRIFQSIGEMNACVREWKKKMK